MFEKEGYEWTVKNISIGISMYNPSIEMYCGKAFKDGAKFGYNKAKEEIQKNGLALQSDMDKTIEQNIALKKQIEKMKCCQNCKFEDNDCIEEPCSACTRCLGDIKRKGNSDKWEIKENA